MPIDRSLWSRSFSSFPHLPCPRCNHGRLIFSDNDAVYQTPAWIYECSDPDTFPWERFSCFMTCSDNACKEITICIGMHRPSGGMLVNIETNDITPEFIFEPRVFYPAPGMIQIPYSTPEPVVRALNLAFEFYWQDLDTCVSKIRSSVELLLDHYSISRTKPDGNFLSLDKRIELLKPEKFNANWLHALRKIGNLGTHGTVTEEETFNAIEIYEIILNFAFGVDPSARADELARLLFIRTPPHPA